MHPTSSKKQTPGKQRKSKALEPLALTSHALDVLAGTVRISTYWAHCPPRLSGKWLPPFRTWEEPAWVLRSACISFCIGFQNCFQKMHGLQGPLSPLLSECFPISFHNCSSMQFGLTCSKTLDGLLLNLTFIEPSMKPFKIR